MQELLLRLVWSAGDPRDFESGTTVGRRFLPRPCASPVKNIEVFSWKRSMILRRKVHRPRPNKMERGEGVVGAETCISTECEKGGIVVQTFTVYSSHHITFFEDLNVLYTISRHFLRGSFTSVPCEMS